MNAILSALGLAARHGRLALIAGLVAGVALPGLALAMKAWLQELVALLLFLAALRIGPRQALGAARDLPVTGGLALLYQLVLPVAAILVMQQAGWLGVPLSTVLVLMLSASSISGSPNLTILTGHDPAPALRLLILGTAILPLTVLPVFWLLPELGTAREVLGSAGRLLAVIALSTVAAFALRQMAMREPSRETIAALDGLSAIAMAVVVIGLMSAVGPALARDPAGLAWWLACAFAANFGLQAVAAVTLANSPLRAATVPFAIIAGNRNIALFLVALPQHVTDPLLVFIGCYQIPMYLTPLLMKGFYSRVTAR